MMRKSVLAILALGLALGACRRAEPEQPTPVPSAATPDTAGQGAARARADSIAAENARREEEARRAAAAEEVRNALTEMFLRRRREHMVLPHRQRHRRPAAQ